MTEILLRISFALLAVTSFCCAKEIGDPPIVGGFAINITQAPYQVSLRYRESHSCGASILSDHVIITAAHCLYHERSPRPLNIAAGSTTRVPMTGQDIQVARFILHPLYVDDQSYDYDVAIIILAGQLQFNDHVQPIPLATKRPRSGTKALVSGWGHLEEEGARGNSNDLQAAEVEVFANSKCTAGYGDNRVTERMICAGAEKGGIDACQNDSGGPLVAEGQLLGIVSWGRGCAREGFPGLYTSIPDLHSWIIETVKNNSINLL